MVRLFPETGRTHQLRVHLAAIGHPLVGDKVYGARGAALRNLAPAVGAFSRQALHAETVQVCHPVSGTPLSISAPYPQDFAHLLTALALREKRDRGGSFKVDSEKNSGYAKT
ncbi:MAG: hypothetical protein E6J80_02290 [Deltaproteobacteria bacterium]|nr:MAG: hypothetical protein E6J80_02290 [Deltaproteobacteria bacterium]